MLAMLCTRCQQREARGLPPEKRAKIEAEFGMPLPFVRDDLCRECWREWMREWVRTPEAKADMERVHQALWAKWRGDLDRWKDNARSAALRALDVADAIAGKL